MDTNYMGPFRSDTDGNFHSGDDDCKPMYLDIKVDVDGPLYESPSTIADTINQQLNNTNVYSDNETNPMIQNSWAQQVELPALTGPLLKIKEVNGINSPQGDNQKLWGNMAVRDMKKWQGIHALMRTDLAFGYNINFNDPANHFKLYQPCFFMPSGHIDNHVYYPRTSQQESQLRLWSGGERQHGCKDGELLLHDFATVFSVHDQHEIQRGEHQEDPDLHEEHGEVRRYIQNKRRQ